MQPRAGAQGWQAKSGTESNDCLQPHYRSTSAVSELSTEGLSPVALLRTCVFTPEEGFPNLHASRISAFPFLKNPIIPWRWWTLPSSAAGCRVGCSARVNEGAP